MTRDAHNDVTSRALAVGVSLSCLSLAAATTESGLYVTQPAGVTHGTSCLLYRAAECHPNYWLARLPSFSDPYCQSTCLCACVSVCRCVENFDAK